MIGRRGFEGAGAALFAAAAHGGCLGRAPGYGGETLKIPQFA